MENVAAEDMLEANLLRSIIKRDFLLEHQQLCGKGIFKLCVLVMGIVARSS